MIIKLDVSTYSSNHFNQVAEINQYCYMSLDCFYYCLRFNCVNITPFIHKRSLKWAFGPFPGFYHYNSATVNIVLHIFLLFFYRSVLAIFSPLLLHTNFRIILIKFCEGKKKPVLTSPGNPSTLENNFRRTDSMILRISIHECGIS